MKSRTRHLTTCLGVLALSALPLLSGTGFSEEHKPWGPFLREPRNGETKPLPERIEKMKDADWRKIAYTDYDGIKPRVAVFLPPVRQDQLSAADMQSDVGKLVWMFSQRGAKNPDGSAGTEIQLRQALGATNRFRMIEGSSTVDDILNEQDFGASGRVSGASAARLKRVTGAQYIARITVLEVNPEKESKDIRIGVGALTGNSLALGSVGISGKVAYCALNAKIVNVETGDIVTDINAAGTSRGRGAGLDGILIRKMTGGLFGAGGVLNTETAASLGEAVQAAVNKIAYLAASRFEDLPVTMAVLDADEKSLSVEGGRDLGLREGMLLQLESKLAPITNAVGDTLDWKRLANGSARIVRVMPAVSLCEYVEGGKGTKRDDLATFEPQRSR